MAAIHTLFEEQVTKTPDNIAVTCMVAEFSEQVLLLCEDHDTFTAMADLLTSFKANIKKALAKLREYNDTRRISSAGYQKLPISSSPPSSSVTSSSPDPLATTLLAGTKSSFFSQPTPAGTADDPMPQPATKPAISPPSSSLSSSLIRATS